MKLKSNLPRRRATRLRRYDYGQTGGYFITICVQDQQCLFGNIEDGKMQLNELGRIVVECWNRIPQHFSSAELDVCVIMPNHMHGVILLGTGGAKRQRPPDRSQPNRRGEVSSPTLGRIVAYFKYQSTKYINQHRDRPGMRIWQRNYYDHVLRDDTDLQRVRQYVTENPMRWELDRLHPDNFAK